MAKAGNYYLQSIKHDVSDQYSFFSYYFTLSEHQIFLTGGSSCKEKGR